MPSFILLYRVTQAFHDILPFVREDKSLKSARCMRKRPRRKYSVKVEREGKVPFACPIAVYSLLLEGRWLVYNSEKARTEQCIVESGQGRGNRDRNR